MVTLWKTLSPQLVSCYKLVVPRCFFFILQVLKIYTIDYCKLEGTFSFSKLYIIDRGPGVGYLSRRDKFKVGTKWSSAETIFFICNGTIKLKQSYMYARKTF